MAMFREVTYWFMGITMVATMLFSFVAITLGGKDMLALVRSLKLGQVDATDDGRVERDE